MSQSPFKSTAASTSTLSTVTAIALVVFALGLFALLVLHARLITDHFRNSVQIQIFLNDQTEESETVRLKKYLETRPYAAHASMVKREEAAAEMEKELGEDFVEFLGFYPIPNSIDLLVAPEYARTDSLAAIEAEILTEPGVREVYYQKALLDKINRFTQRAGVALLAFSMLLLLVAVALVNNTISLAVFSKRFLIKSMQLVGATAGFIRRPFIKTGLVQGLVSGLIAISLMVPVLYYVRGAIPELSEISDPFTLSMTAVGMVLFSVLFSGVCTLFAINRYLRLHREQLY